MCLAWSRKQQNIDREKALDGIYVIRTSESAETLDDNRATRDPVAKAIPSPDVRNKCATKESSDGMPLRRWDGLIGSLSTLVRNTCRVGESKTAVRFKRDTEPDAYQKRVFELLAQDASWWPNKCAQ